jgi:His/Glu/Gln/Arg/opine family amino acid ABC transporter permease subunit
VTPAGRARLCAVLVLSCLRVSPAGADALADVRARGTLVWGGDQEGGGPYVYPREDDPTRVTGFEVEIAARLADFLGVKAVFSQGQWDRMPDLLRTRKVDVVLNGYESTPARLEAMEATLPYYVYGLELLARGDDGSIASWADLAGSAAKAPRKRVGVLTGSAAESYLREHTEIVADIVSYDGNTDALREVETGKIDATLQDTPIVAFYGTRFPRLRTIGAPVGRGYYVLYARKGETALVSALNEAFIVMIRSGALERIYRRWGLWNEAQQELAPIAEAGRFYGYDRAVEAKVEGGALPVQTALERSKRPRGWQVVARYGPILLESAGVTVVLSVLSFPLAIVAGLLVALGRLYGPSWLRLPLAAYVEFLRGTPLMLQLYFIFFFLPEVGVVVPAFWTAILGLAVNYSAYESEIYRAGLQAIPPGQMEAALSLGMSRRLALRRIVVPQAVRIVVPPVVNDFIALFKDTSVCSVVTLVELTKRFSVLSQSTQATSELMALTAILYLLMSAPLTVLSRGLERRLARAATA